MYREKLFDMSIVKIQQKEYHNYERLDIHEEIYKHISPDIGHLYPFPSELGEIEDDKKAVLSYKAGETSVGWLYDLASYFLRGKYSLLSTLHKVKVHS